jgi:hypothetical protein
MYLEKKVILRKHLKQQNYMKIASQRYENQSNKYSVQYEKNVLSFILKLIKTQYNLEIKFLDYFNTQTEIYL